MPHTIETFLNSKFTDRFHFFCAWLDFLLTIFLCSLLNCECSCSQVTTSFLAVCLLIVGYAVCIFHATDAKYTMFHVG